MLDSKYIFLHKIDMVDSSQLIIVSLVLLSNIKDTLLLISKMFNLKTKKKRRKKKKNFKNAFA